MRKDDTLLLYVPVPLYRDIQGGLLVEAQAVNGLRHWARNFSQVIVMMPLSAAPAPTGWTSVPAHDPDLGRVRFEPLPMAYRPDQFLRHLPKTRLRIRKLISEAQWLSFAIGGLFGDWGAVSSLTAHKMGRPFSVWTDRVESEVTRQAIATGSLKSRIRARLTYRPMVALERAVVRRASLGLFHGRETYDAYAPFARGPAEVVHDIHLSARDHIEAESLLKKASQTAEGPLEIIYVGRAEPMKGPLDWIEVLKRLSARGVDFRAQWLGDGSARSEMLSQISHASLKSRVDLPGFLADRAAVMRQLRSAHIFLFCHLTPESPRCLIEALASGCPIVGYDSPYPRDLLSRNGGGILVSQRDTDALAEEIAVLDRERGRLAHLVHAAAQDGKPFTDEAVFEHRSNLIRRHLAG